MTNLSSQFDRAVDVVFPVDGSTLARDHGQALQAALCAQLPWLGNEALAGIHAIKLVPGGADPALLSRRSRLLVRLGAARAADLLALRSLELDVDGHILQLGAPHLRELQPHATLYAYKVAADSGDEMALMDAVNSELSVLAIGGERVCGKRQHMLVSGRTVTTFSLMLHALSPEQSLRLQQHGLGPYRLMGCGIFVAHKSAAAV